MDTFSDLSDCVIYDDEELDAREKLKSALLEIEELTKNVDQDKQMTLKNLEQIEELIAMSQINDEVITMQALEIDQLVTQKESLERQLKAKDAKIKFLMKYIGIDNEIEQIEE